MLLSTIQYEAQKKFYSALSKKNKHHLSLFFFLKHQLSSLNPPHSIFNVNNFFQGQNHQPISMQRENGILLTMTFRLFILFLLFYDLLLNFLVEKKRSKYLVFLNTFYECFFLLKKIEIFKLLKQEYEKIILYQPIETLMIGSHAN